MHDLGRSETARVPASGIGAQSRRRRRRRGKRIADDGKVLSPDLPGGDQGEGDCKESHEESRVADPLLACLDGFTESRKHTFGEPKADSFEQFLVQGAQPGGPVHLVTE